MEKKEAGTSVSQNEMNDADTPGYEALEIFEANQEGFIFVKDEVEELEAYGRDNLVPYSDKADEAYNKADAYYQDAKQLYEQLLRTGSTS